MELPKLIIQYNNTKKLYLKLSQSKLTDVSKKSPTFSKTASVKTNINFTAVITLLEIKVSEKILTFTLVFCLLLHKVFTCLLRFFRKQF